MTRVLLVVPRAAFREPLAYLLGREPGVAAVAPAASLAEARAVLTAGFAPHVALVEPAPGDECAATIAAVRAAAPAGTRVLALGDGPGLAGADEALPLSAPLGAILAAVRRLAVDEDRAARCARGVGPAASPTGERGGPVPRPAASA